MLIKTKNVRNLAFSFVASSFVFSFWLSYFQLTESSHQKVYAHVRKYAFLFHMHARVECLLGLVVEGNSCWDHKVFSVTASLVSCNNLDLGWNTAADLWDSLLNNIDCLINQTNVGCIPF